MRYGRTAALLRIAYRKSAQKALKGMQPAKADTIRKYIRKRAADPTFQDNNLKPLSGVKNGFRRVFGNWRVSFVLDTDGGEIDVFEIAPRGGAYEW